MRNSRDVDDELFSGKDGLRRIPCVLQVLHSIPYQLSSQKKPEHCCAVMLVHVHRRSPEKGFLHPAILQSESLILNAYPSDLRAEVRHLGFHPDDLGNSNEFMYLRSGGAAAICRFQRMPKSRQYMRQPSGTKLSSAITNADRIGE